MLTAPWDEFARQEPDFAAYVERRIEEHGLALLATLDADGGPRISGIEPIFAGGQMWLAMMPRSRKGADLRRDGRFALHNATVDKDVTQGDVKINGLARLLEGDERVGAPDVGDQADLFGVDLTRVSSIRVGDAHLVMEHWRPGEALTRRTRQ